MNGERGTAFEPVDLPDPVALQRFMKAEFPATEQQWEAISAPLEPSVVIAGAGSGKTTLMAARVVYLVATGQVAPEQVLGLTFTTKAANELAVRVRQVLLNSGLLPDARMAGTESDELAEALEPTIATYNAYAASLLVDHGLRIGFEPDTRVLADASRYQLAMQVVSRYAGEITELTTDPATAVLNLLALDSSMSEHVVSPEQVLEHDAGMVSGFDSARAEEQGRPKPRTSYLKPIDVALGVGVRRAELIGLIRAYRQAKADYGLMDFSEQIELAARLVAEHRDVSRAERARFKVVLLDEYQDTSVAQARLLSGLFSGPPGDGRGHPVTAVGDPNQAIYGWRGASVHNILRFSESFPGDARRPEYNLSVSQRSKPLILDVANTLAQPLYDKLPGVQPLRSRPDAAGGTVEVEVFETRAQELADLATRVRAAHDSMSVPAWSQIGVLTRDNATAAMVFDALSSVEIPVEIVGLAGLLRLPEVAEVFATLTLLHTVTDNPSMLTLLTGPRWDIGPRDLALLGRRAGNLALVGLSDPEREPGLPEDLAESVAGADPTEIACLHDAVADPGDAGYSDQARWRFEQLAAELRQLRQFASEPLLDLVRRIIDVTGVDIELASSLSPAAPARRENLDLFVKAVADFSSVSGETTLPALLAYLKAEDELGNGLDIATPSTADSVKLLTMHRAKGLEWHSVFLVGICESKLPHGTSRPVWCSSPKVMPARLRGDAADLPHLQGFDKPAINDYMARNKAHDQAEELRLAYVAITRAAQFLRITSHLWTPERKTALGPSPYQAIVRDHLARIGEPVGRWLDKPDRTALNPALETATAVPWPPEPRRAESERRQDAARRVREAAAALAAGEVPDEPEDLAALAVVNAWDGELDQLIAEAERSRPDVLTVPLPSTLSATSLARLRDDPAGFAVDLARPVPRRPVPAARFGTRFHAWVEGRFGQQQMLDPDELPGRADTGIGSEAELRELVQQFEAGEFADRVPVAVEPAFSLVLGSQVIRGRIDAVYAEPDGFLVVDWKTNQQQNADPLQLAVYRLAWAELHGIDPAQVRAAFHYVRSGETLRFDELPDRAELARMLDVGRVSR